MISVADAVEIVDVAAEVKADMAGDPSDLPVSLRKSLSILDSIGASLRHDLPRGQDPV